MRKTPTASSHIAKIHRDKEQLMMQKPPMKQLIDITDEDALEVINSIHILTKNTILSRGGSLGLDFAESFRKYGSAYIEFELYSSDGFDGQHSTRYTCRLVFHHNTCWFAEYQTKNKPSNYNKNHYFGYLKLKELGYTMPDRASI